MKKKKILTLLIPCIMVFALFACDAGGDSSGGGGGAYALSGTWLVETNPNISPGDLGDFSMVLTYTTTVNFLGMEYETYSGSAVINGEDFIVSCQYNVTLDEVDFSIYQSDDIDPDADCIDFYDIDLDTDAMSGDYEGFGVYRDSSEKGNYMGEFSATR